MLWNTVHLVIYLAAFLSTVKGNCRNCIKCDVNGECLEGCKPGFAGRTCGHECSCHCVDSLCDYDASTGTFPCSIGCTPGYYGRHCNTPCTSTNTNGMCDRFSGTSPDCQGSGYGNNCKTSCQDKCNGSVCDNKGKCFQGVCIPGWYGAACNMQCEAECEYCHKGTGQCLKQNERIDVPHNSSCSCTASGGEQLECDNGYFIATISLSILIGIAVLAIIFLCCIRFKTVRRKDKYQDKESGEIEMLNKEGGELAEESQNDTDRLGQGVEELGSSESKLVKQGKTSKNKRIIETEQMEKKLRNYKAYFNKIVSQEQAVEQFSGLYRLNIQDFDSTFLLFCTNIQFSKTKYNAKNVHINAEGELINTSQTGAPHSNQRLKTYKGTSSTVPLTECGSPQYFEVKSRIGIAEPLTESNLLLEIGLAREEEQDKSHYIGGQSQSYSLTVSHCTTHSSICRKICRRGRHTTCLPDTLKNRPGTSILHYSVVYDRTKGRIAFLDVIDKRIIGKIDSVDTSVGIWPMFGAYNSEGKIVMSLIVGNDIDMTIEKKSLIVKCLT